MNGLKYPRDWEPVNSNTHRLRVPGGWLVHTGERLITGDKIYVNSEALVVLPDKEAHWVLEKP